MISMKDLAILGWTNMYVCALSGPCAGPVRPVQQFMPLQYTSQPSELEVHACLLWETHPICELCVSQISDAIMCLHCQSLEISCSIVSIYFAYINGLSNDFRFLIQIT